jgi:hypoxanthine phosphoribosyltransferase
MTTTHYKTLDWPTVREHVLRLASIVSSSGFAPSILVAVARGGWVPTRMLSDALGVKRIASIGLAYTDSSRKQLDTYSMPTPISSADRILLIEDVLESGKSLQLAQNKLQALGAEVKTAALYTTLKTEFSPDFSLEVLLSPPTFPWEMKDI